MARNDPELRVRIPEDVQAELQAAAKANGRTLTAEVLARLVLPSASIESQIDDLEHLKTMIEHHRMTMAAYEDYIHTLKSGMSILGEIVIETFAAIAKDYKVSEEVQKRWINLAQIALELADRPSQGRAERTLKPIEILERLNRNAHVGAVVGDPPDGTSTFLADAATHLSRSSTKLRKP